FSELYDRPCLEVDRSAWLREARNLMTRVFCLALTCLALVVPPAGAHYNMLLPHAASVKQGETVTFFYLWGHPFEHQLFDAPMPQDITVLTPAGLKIGLTRMLKKVPMATAEAKDAAAYRFDFMP